MTYSVIAVVVDDDDERAYEECIRSAVSFEQIASDVVDVETAELIAREAREGYQG